MSSDSLPIVYYRQPTLVLARNLLGKLLVHDAPDGRASGYIVETEAYIGPADKAAHSYGGRITPRTKVMYGPPGRAYVYFIYGMHYCLNVVSGTEGAPEAILIRALEPVNGIPLMIRRRGLSLDPDAGHWPIRRLKQLTNGPGKLAQAMGISKQQYGWSLTDSLLQICPGLSITPEQIASGPRIGIEYAEEARDNPWRFWIRDNPFVSKS